VHAGVIERSVVELPYRRRIIALKRTQPEHTRILPQPIAS
jgi:hypothetical protein